MTPVVFDGCFGWLHPAAGSRGVVMCAPLGYEELCTHRPWRGLAERIAAAGMPVLRFDYRGAGDSAGGDLDPARLRAWLDSVKAAVAWMRARAGVTEIAIVGLRLGGTMATLVAEEIGGVDSLALIAPVVAGRGHVRELKTFAAFRPGQAMETAPVPSDSDALEVGGFTLTPETMRDLATIDLRKVAARPARRAFILSPNEAPTDRRFGEVLAALGVDVSVEPFPGYRKFMDELVYGQEIPHATFEALTAWLGAGMVFAATGAAAPTAPARLEFDGVVEEAAFFGRDQRLFGISCAPATLVSSGPTVLFVNTGNHHRIGFGRFAVELARHLASRGVASLRIDVAGLGDSPEWPGKAENGLYDKESCADVSAAIDWLEARGRRDVTVVGLCSGAYLAYHAAAADLRIKGQVLVNLQAFEWRAGDSFQVVCRTIGQSGGDLAGSVARALGSAEAWRRMLRGDKADRERVRAMAERGLGLAARRMRSFHDKVFGWRPSENPVARQFDAFAARRLRSLLVYSEGDNGLAVLENHELGTAGARLVERGGARVEIVAGADHTLSDRAARSRFTGLLDGFLGLDGAATTAPSATAAPAVDEATVVAFPQPSHAPATAPVDARAEARTA